MPTLTIPSQLISNQRTANTKEPYRALSLPAVNKQNVFHICLKMCYLDHNGKLLWLGVNFKLSHMYIFYQRC